MSKNMQCNMQNIQKMIWNMLNKQKNMQNMQWNMLNNMQNMTRTRNVTNNMQNSARSIFCIFDKYTGMQIHYRI